MSALIPSLSKNLYRYRVRVRGQVQGVGFRPFVFRLATDLGLSGWVRNDGEGVEIQVQGLLHGLDGFLNSLRNPPILARIDGFEIHDLLPEPDEDGFTIAPSQDSSITVGVTPDMAICTYCLAELFDPQDRRYRYPFINCTHCGPRYTITGRLPYDRCHTSMAGFVLCSSCADEYNNPLDRRFHAQPNACPVCGPRLTLHDAQGQPLAENDVIAAARADLLEGKILAIKGLGGFHLICDARNREAVSRLRERKHRQVKPLAVMMANRASLNPWVEYSEAEQSLLESPERPIVLLGKRPDCDQTLTGVAPGMAWLGVMLPYTPVHYLLFYEAAGRPAGSDWLTEPQDLVLVSTSANPGGEPLVIDDSEALRRLEGIADGFVLHNRDILVRCDDSVMHWNGRAPAFIRRARGYTPRRIKLPHPGPSVLACGGWLKNTVCLTRGDEAYVSPHIGDLDNRASCMALEETVSHLLEVLRIEPQRVACDLHPDFHSSRFAEQFAHEYDLPCLTVQHHHAHIAAVMAEHRIEGPVLGLALDGVGLGEDGSSWGGELLYTEGAACQRLGHLRTLPLPGGDRAAREPWRMVAAVLHTLGRGEEISRRFPGDAAGIIRRMLEQGVNIPHTSSAGRWFDAAAGLLGVRRTMSYEGQAAMELEGLAMNYGEVAPLEDGYRLDPDDTLDLLSVMAHLAESKDSAYGAAVFHATLVRALADWILKASTVRDIPRIVLGGGCFLNRLLSKGLRDCLQAEGLSVYEAEHLPPNDGGLSLGQAWVAMTRGR